jgi:hypothetical protein
MSMHKKAIATLMAVLMIAAVSAVSVFALAEGEYTASLTANLPSGAPPHDLDFLVNPATVTTDDDYSTVAIELESPATVTVTPPYGSPYVAEGEIVDVTAVTVGYSAGIEDGQLVVTGPSSVVTDDFAPVIIFEIKRADDEPHDNMPATLHLEAID